MNQDTKKSFSRRHFVKGSIIVGAGAIGAVALAANASKADGVGGTPAADEGGGTPAAKKVSMYRGYYPAHGEKAFTQAVVAVDEAGAILALNIDEYQYMDSTVSQLLPVPNATRGFGNGNNPEVWLVSKSDNDAYYSELMATKGGATQGFLTSIKAIEEFAVGKKPSELTGLKPDAVSGSTLVDTHNYLGGLDEIVKAGQFVSEGSYIGDGTDLEMGRVNYAAHGSNCFTNAVSLVQGSSLVCTSIDDFQYMASTTPNLEGVPNSDKSFGKNYVEGRVLSSKLTNNASYSQNMIDRGGATQDWATSIKAIEAAVAGGEVHGFKASELDAVSGSTLVDNVGYSKTAVIAATEAWWQG